VRLVHLTSSTFFGGPERQMLGLAEAMAGRIETAFISFSEKGRSRHFLDTVRARGFDAYTPAADFPHLRAAVRETTALLGELACDVLLCHGYKANLLGRIAARRTGIPAIAVARGWTGESRRVRTYEWLDRRHLRFMDHVVCVSDGQAERVRRWCRVPATRISVIRNSARLAALETADPDARERLHRLFAGDAEVTRVVLAAGRLSPEKGFGVLVESAAAICRENPGAGIAIFGEGGLRQGLERRVEELGLSGRVVLPGFRDDLDFLIGAADVVVLPSFTEGLPNVALEAGAAAVPVVATAVGGTPEVVADGVTGFLVPPGDAAAIAERVSTLLGDRERATRMGVAGRDRMRRLFTFDAQAAAYLELLHTFRPARLAA
jgi:glycosyltransferase involved in cell wall biosynthesis